MSILNPSALQARGAAVAQRFRSENRRLVLIYCGVIALLTLGINGLHLYLDSQISGTGGLSGLGTRSTLQTIQELLTYINFLYGPFWTAGFLYAMLSPVRGQMPCSGDLKEGFRRFGRVLAHTGFQLFLLIAIVTIAVYLSALIYTVTILGTNLSQKLEPVLSDPGLITASGQFDLSKIPPDILQAITVTMLIMTVLLAAPVCIWLSYYFRMSLYLVMERPISGVWAYFESMRLMRGHKKQLFRLDLSFWWYHVPGLLIALVGYLDTILALLGIPLPLDSTEMFLLTAGAYCVLQTVLFLWKKCDVDAAYLLAYEAIAHPEPVQASVERE